MDHATTHVTPPKTYLIVFAALVVLLVLSVVASSIEHDLLNLMVAMLIAVGKTALIVSIFMGMRHSTTTSRLFALTGVAWLALLLVLMMSDYLTR